MVLKADQLRVKALLTETITLLCKNGLNYRSEFAIEALIGITLDKDDVFLISIKEKIAGGMGMLDKVESPERDFQVEISGPGSAHADMTDRYDDGESDENDGEATATTPAPRQLFKREKAERRRQRRRRRASYDETEPLATSQSGDSANFAMPDFDIEKALDDANSLQAVASYTTERRNAAAGDGASRDNSLDSEMPDTKKARVEDAGESIVKEETDDDIIVIKEELPSDMGSCAMQQTYSMSGHTLPTTSALPSTDPSVFHTPMSSAPVFPGNSSWTAPAAMPSSLPSASAGSAASQGNASLTPSSHMQQDALSAARASPPWPPSSSSPDKPYACSTCSKTFTTPSWLRMHEDMHRGLYHFCCDVCGKGFSCTSNLRRHSVMHRAPSRDHSCAMCGATFSYSYLLRKHMMKHA